MRMSRIVATAFVLFCGQPVYSATIHNSADIDICVLPSGSLLVSWSASARVVGEDPESVQSLSLSGELRSHSNLLCTQGGVSLGTCSRTVQQPGGATLVFCGGELSTSCGFNYFRSSSVSFSTPAKPSNGKQWSSCKFGECGADQCFFSKRLTMLEKILGLPICF